MDKKLLNLALIMGALFLGTQSVRADEATPEGQNPPPFTSSDDALQKAEGVKKKFFPLNAIRWSDKGPDVDTTR